MQSEKSEKSEKSENAENAEPIIKKSFINMCEISKNNVFLRCKKACFV